MISLAHCSINRRLSRLAIAHNRPVGKLYRTQRFTNDDYDDVLTWGGLWSFLEVENKEFWKQSQIFHHRRSQKIIPSNYKSQSQKQHMSYLSENPNPNEQAAGCRGARLHNLVASPQPDQRPPWPRGRPKTRVKSILSIFSTLIMTTCISRFTLGDVASR